MKDGRVLGDNINGINQLMPIIHKFAWEAYNKGSSNVWFPNDVPMHEDIKQWKDLKALTQDERFLLTRCLGFFAGAESLVGNNLLLTIFKYVTDPDCRQFLIRQAFEESLHNAMVIHICESLSLPHKEVHEAYIRIPSIKKKDDFLLGITEDSMNLDNYDYRDIEAKRKILRNIITYYVICEGIFFYSGFAMLLSFGRQNKMKGICQQIQYTLRDESNHIEFGFNLINLIKKQEGKALWDNKFEMETIGHIVTATQIEIEYAKDLLPRGVLGLNSNMFVKYMEYIANRRVESLGLPVLFPKSENTPFPWMSEEIDLRKNKNFFESTVLEYQTGTIKDDF